MRYQRQPDLVERHLVGETAGLPGLEESGGFGAREVVVPEQRLPRSDGRPSEPARGCRGTARGPGNRWFAELAKLRRRKQARRPRAPTDGSASTCSMSVVPERGKPMTKIGCGTSARTVARGSSSNLSRTKNCLEAREECFDGFSSDSAVRRPGRRAFVLPSTKSRQASSYRPRRS